MSLATNVHPDKLLRSAQEHSKPNKVNVQLLLQRDPSSVSSHSHSIPAYDVNPIPKYQIPAVGVSAETAYNLIHDELALDGTPILNLASFVGTHMHEYGDRLMIENLNKNLVDYDEYPATTLIHQRCISMLAKLWHADEAVNATGTATTGSSEAIQLAGLAMKKRWQDKMIALGKDERRPGPNIIMGCNAQVALEKFARYFDVEARMIPVTESSKYCLDASRVREFVDENTIGVFVILGSTYTGHYEDVKAVSDVLDAYEKESGNHVPIHVDGASGALYAPFATPSLVWDFKLPRVVSINTSGHKWGGVYVGVGWIVWRDVGYLPQSMIFELHYLGSIEKSFSLNFSRPAAQIIASYFNFLYLGFDKYRSISLHEARNARLFARAIENSKYYTVLSDIHRLASTPSSASTVEGLVGKVAQATIGREKLVDDIDRYIPCLPVVAFRFSDRFAEEYPNVEAKSIQTLLRSKGWIVPHYELPPSLEKVQILRVVVREQFTEDLVERLVENLMEITEDLMKSAGSGKVHHEEHLAKRHAASKSHHSVHSIRASGHDSVC